MSPHHLMITSIRHRARARHGAVTFCPATVPPPSRPVPRADRPSSRCCPRSLVPVQPAIRQPRPLPRRPGDTSRLIVPLSDAARHAPVRPPRERRDRAGHCSGAAGTGSGCSPPRPRGGRRRPAWLSARIPAHCRPTATGRRTAVRDASTGARRCRSCAAARAANRCRSTDLLHVPRRHPGVLHAAAARLRGHGAALAAGQPPRWPRWRC